MMVAAINISLLRSEAIWMHGLNWIFKMAPNATTNIVVSLAHWLVGLA
jgi:hypothetical protein